MVESTVMDITPDVAGELLEKNKNIRRINPHRVDDLAGKMRRGVFFTTHQGIAINEDGRLIDGQHRLAAVVKSGVTVRMLVSIIPDEASIGVDCGMIRSTAVLTGAPPREAQPARFMLAHICGHRVVSPDLVVDLVGAFSKDVEYLSGFLSTWNKSKVTPAPVRAALILLSRDDTWQHFAQNASGLVSGDLASCDPAIVTLWKFLVAGRSAGAAGKQINRFRTTFYAFTRPSLQKLGRFNDAAIDEQAKDVFRHKYGGKFFYDSEDFSI